MKKDIVALVLAGGAGNRFWPIKQDKILFPFNGKPFLSHTVLDVLTPDINRIVIVANNTNVKQLSELTYPIPHKILVQTSPRGMADALLSASEFIRDTSVMIFIGDHLIEADQINRVLDRAKTSNVFGILSGWKTDTYFPGGYLQLDGDKIIGILEKPEPGNEPSPYVYVTGMYIEDPTVLLDVLQKTTSDEDNIFEIALTNLARSKDFRFIPYEGLSSTLKYPWNILDVMGHILTTQTESYKGNDVVIKDYVTIEGPVYIGNNVKIFECTKITGPCYIGDNTIIGNNNMIRHSHIGANCVTGFNTDITRSYIGDNCWFHSNYIGDSIIESNVSMGSGTVLANLRFDENSIHSIVKNNKINTQMTKLGAIIATGVRMGVNVSTMPGVKIGTESFIGAATLVDHDIPDKSFFGHKTEPVLKAKIHHDSTSKRDAFRKNIG